MKRFYFSKLIFPIVFLLGCNMSASAQSPVVFSYSAGCSFQTYSVPAGVFSVVVDMSGAKGSNDYFNVNNGGYGGRVQCSLATVPGQILNILVGGTGTANNGSGTAVAGGCNGGGAGGSSTYYGGSGGGASDIRLGGTGLNNRVIVAGGGGGAGYISSGCGGGAGGGPTAGNGSGYYGSGPGYGGRGGSQSAPGAGGTYCYCPTGSAGSANVGGSGGGYGSGSGGGGYFGGGSGSYYAGGGGGSSYPATDAGIVTSVVHTPNFNSSGNGSVTLQPICTPPTPGTITGNLNLCGAGVNVPMTFTGSGGGGWYSSNGGVATISNTGVVTSIAPGTTVISYSLVYACGTATDTKTLTVNSSAPAIGGTLVVCTNATTTLTPSSGGTWTVSNPFQAIVGSSSGIVTGISAGNPIVTYTQTTTGCFSVATTTVNPGPAPIAGTLSACVGSTTTLTNSVSGGNWTSGGTGVATVAVGTGTVTAVAPGTAPIFYTLISNGCAVSANVTVNALPNLYSVSGGGSYCFGGSGSTPILLSNSTTGVNYQLMNGAAPVGGPLAGVTGGTLNYGGQTVGGTYTVLATNAASGCSRTMTGSAVVSVSPLPVAYLLHFVGGNSFCATDPGRDLVLDNSETGVLYQLYFNGLASGGPRLGTASTPLDFGVQSAAGLYAVLAFNTSTGCSNYMTTSPTLSINPVPDVYNVTGGGDFCAGGAGKHVGLDWSTPGISYQLFNGTALGTVMGSNSALDFGAQPAAGSYTAVATNSITGCTSNMAGAVSVTIDPLPNTYPISGSGHYCAGGTGVDISIISDFGINYQLYHGATAVGVPQNGNGSTLDLGMQTAAGSYTAVGIDATTGCTSNMGGSAVVSIDPLPAVQTVSAAAPGSYCLGGTGVNVTMNPSAVGVSYQLYYQDLTGAIGIAPGAPVMHGTGGTISFGSQRGAGNYSVVATTDLTGCTNTMAGSPSIAINPLPGVVNVTGGGDYCAGGTGNHVGLDFTNLGTTYQLYLGSTATGSPVVGSGTDVDFGFKTTPGTYTVMATNITNGCTNLMNGNAIISIDPLPAAFGVLGSGSYCAGGTGINVSLSGSASGISYQLYKGGVAMGSPMTGVGTPFSFGMQTDPGVYTVVAANTATGCTNNMTGNANIAVNALPTPFTLTGGGEYCAGGAGLHVGLSQSSVGISYQLMNGSAMVGSPMLGTGHALDFGLNTAAGSYTIMGTNVTTACAGSMSNNATVTIDPLPVAYAMTGGGNYCVGGSGVHVGLANSAIGINYQLYNGTTAVGAAIPGVTGSSIDFGLQTAAGTYWVSAVNTITGCTNNMTGTAVINTASLPTVYTVTGGGAFCEGSTGVHVGLTGSVSGISYQLMNAGAAMGSAVTGTGSSLDFGAITTGGTYTVMATNVATSCTSNMAAAAMVTVNPVPVPYAVAGGGNYCSGGSGVGITLSGSGWGNNYQLYNGSVATGLPIGGTGAGLNFGLQTGGGTYKIVAINTTTGCSSNMMGNPVIVVDPSVTPSVAVASDLGLDVCAGTVTTYMATPSNGGSAPVYQWMINGVNAGAGDMYSYVPMSGDIVSVSLTSNAHCALPATVTRAVSMTVHPYVLPSATITADPGSAICPNTTVTYSATMVNAGSAPVLTWMKGNIPVGTGTSYTYTPANNDVINFRLNSNAMCHSADTVFSNDIVMKIQTPPAPVFNITSHVGTVIGVGRVDSLWANITSGGASNSYQWYINGYPIHGATSSRYVANPVFDMDSFSCVVTTDGPCGGVSSSQHVVVYLINLGVSQAGSTADLMVLPNPNKGTFTLKGSLGTNSDEEVAVEVTNVLGQVVYTGKIIPQNGNINQQIQLSNNITNGMYLLNLSSGTQHSVFHMVIEK